MPPPPAAVADIGGGPGRYALWLAGLGYTVQHRDLMDLHVDQLRSVGHPSIETAAGDARDVDLPDSSVDAVCSWAPSTTYTNVKIGSTPWKRLAG